MVNFSTATVPLRDILLDPNNFRFSEPGDTTSVSESRFAELKVQQAALEKLKEESLPELKLSITENGFVPVERIVVRALPQSDDGISRYVVVEGNRRTAALKLLEQEHAGGVDLSPSLVEVFDAVPVLLAEDASEDDILSVMGIRHVGGPKEWGGYQSALLVFRLMSRDAANPRAVASRLGLSVNEVNRRYRAFSALTQMMNDEEYGDAVKPAMYPIFHEAVGQTVVREWLGWSPSERLFKNDAHRELFYGWLTKGDPEPKIRGYGDVRDLRQILENEDALTALKDDDQTLSDALAIVKADAKAVRWLPNVKSTLASLDDLGSDTIESLTPEEIELLTRLKKRADWIIRAHGLVAAAVNDDEG